MFRPHVLLTLLFMTVSVFGDDDLAERRLRDQARHFDEKIVATAENVFTAVGYSVSNVSMVVGKNGVVIIDTGMGLDDAERIAVEFEKRTNKPVKAIVFTHSHGDHTGGAPAFFGAERPQIWAHHNYGSEARAWSAGNLTIQNRRGARQAGFQLPPDQRINNGIAPVRYPKRGGGVFSSQKDTTPTHFLEEERLNVELAGLKFELVDAPGETNDQLFVWFPEGRVLFVGDNFYRSFPNLYAIRGTPNRSVRLWADSLSKLIDYQAVALVGGHTDPVIGAENVRQTLVNYRDAVQFIHDQTVEGINQGMGPDELATTVKLPKNLAELEYLQPFYGHPEWGVRSVFNGYLGWFDGNPTHLFPLSPSAEAQRVALLAGGIDRLVEVAKQALTKGDNQWAAQLADHLLAIDRNHQTAKQIKAEALDGLARSTVNATARNYYQSVARELRTARTQ
ncbi:MAG: alkyl/aryl-sulfatase [Planctomycetota bacterium]